jgi:hypothetical protein
MKGKPVYQCWSYTVSLISPTPASAIGPFSYSSFQSTVRHQPTFIKGSNIPYLFVSRVNKFPRPDLPQHSSNEVDSGSMVPFRVSFVPDSEDAQNAGYVNMPKWTRLRYWGMQQWEEHHAFQFDPRVLSGIPECASLQCEEALFNMSGARHRIVTNLGASGVVRTKHLIRDSSEAYHHARRKCQDMIKSPAHAAVLGFAAHLAKQKKRKRKSNTENDCDGGADADVPAPKRVKTRDDGSTSTTNAFLTIPYVLINVLSIPTDLYALQLWTDTDAGSSAPGSQQTRFSHSPIAQRNRPKSSDSSTPSSVAGYQPF